VAIGENAHQEAIDQGALADHDLADLLPQSIDER